MTGPEHYREAERLLKDAARWESNIQDDLDSYAPIDSARRAAQVHATLALVAATAAQPCAGNDGSESLMDYYDWAEAIA